MKFNAANGAQPYQVEFSESTRELMLRLQRQASDSGRGEEFLAAMREAIAKMRYSPLVAGEPQYHLPAMKLQVRTIALRPLIVHYAVCDDRSTVYIKSVALME